MDTIRYSNIMKALSHPNRLELFLEISKHDEKGFEDCECFITDIAKCLKIGAPTISHHLKELSNAGLITTERRGKFLVAKPNREVINELGNLFPKK